MRGYLRRRYRLPADLEEVVAAELWAAGTLGLETVEEGGGLVRVEAWFEAGADAEPVAPRPGVEALGADTVAEEDWLAAYRERARPFALGLGFWADPREPDPAAAAPPGRRLLRLPARDAFGTGSHESTRLAVELLEGLPLAGRAVIDVGTGTGVLAFAALACGARVAVAFDLDPAAALQARANAALNGMAPRLFAGTVDALAPSARFDLALVNLVAELALPLLPAVAGRLAADGGLLLSGILVERAGAVLAAARRLGFGAAARRVEGEWVALWLRRGAAA